MNNKKIPKILSKILDLVIADSDFSHLKGDYEEIYHSLCSDRGKLRATLWIVKQIFKTLLTTITDDFFWSMIMLKNYVVIAFRNIRKNSGYSLINIFGFSLGLSVCLFLIKMIMFLSSFDDFHENIDRLYKITTSVKSNSGSVQKYFTSPPPLSEKIKDESPAIEKIAKLAFSSVKSASYNKKALPLKSAYADNGFFNLFNIEILSGKSASLLFEPNTVVITDRLSRKFFGDENPIGKTLYLDQVGDAKIAGLIKEIPYNSQFHDLEMLISYPTLVSNLSDKDGRPLEDWINVWNPRHHLYFLLAENSDLGAVRSYLKQIEKDHMTDDKYEITFSLMPVDETIYAVDHTNNSFGMLMPRSVVLVLSFCVLIIILSACFNYTSLSSARALTRLKEIGMRKVMGAQQKQIFTQFITESILLMFFSFGIAIYLHKIIIAMFMKIHWTFELVFNFDDSYPIYSVFLLFTILTGFLTGLLPSGYLSRLKPIDILSNLSRNKILSKSSIRKALIFFQLGISLLFIIITSSALKQYKYAQEMDLGFKTDDIVNVRLRPEQFDKFKNSLSENSQITNISASAYIPGTMQSYVTMAKKIDEADSLRLYYLTADDRLIENLNLKIIAGKNFPENVSTERYILLNETAVKKFGFENAQSALDGTIQIGGKTVSIIGVVKDFVHYAYYSQIEPLVLRNRPEQYNFANIKTNNSERKEIVQYLENKWAELYPNILFRYQYFDEAIDESIMGVKLIFMVGTFISVLAISVACLGLLGITMYNVETRIKEIGIRKTLGADSKNIIRLFTKEYGRIMLIVSLVIAPIGYFLNKIILQNFANHAEYGILDIAQGVVIMYVIGFITILSQLVRAVRVNPVNSLRQG